MEFLIGIGTSIVGKAAEYIVEPVARQIGYLFYYKSNVVNLKTQIQELKYAKERIQHSIDEAIRNGEEIEGDVQNWQSKAGKITAEAETLLPRVEGQASARCFGGSSWNLIMRYKLSKKARKMAQVAVREIQDVGKFSKVSYRPPLQISVKNKGYATFETRTPTFSGIMEALRDVSIRVIGVWGMGGVGKTVLVKEVASHAKNGTLFSQVILITVSQTPDYEKIQQEVAENLGLDVEGYTSSVRRQKLEDRLRKENKILLILDDIWSKLDLDAIGISFADDQKGCKILMTSRSEDVLRNGMNVDVRSNFKLEVLSDCEAANLFNQTVGDLMKELDFQTLGAQIVKECAGLPLAISTVANALKNKNVAIWKNALQELRTSNPTNIKGMHEKVHSSIKLSYNFLRSEEAKSLLLLCSIHEEDEEIRIDDLWRYGVGLNLFQGINKLEDARNRVLTLVENLRTSSLLLDGYRVGLVKMHDVVRDVALTIASEEKDMYNIKHVGELEVILKKNRLKDMTAISLCCNDDDNNEVLIPERISCSKLLFFRLIRMGYDNTTKLSDQFFEVMKELRVLNLNSVRIWSFPQSLCFLQNLQALFLCNFDSLTDIAWVGELRNLEILYISGHHVEVIPKKLGQLTRLRSLDLSDCRNVKEIEPGVISSLVRLEELSIGRGRSIIWAVIEEVTDGRSNVCLTELQNLPHLTTLQLNIRDANILPRDLFTDKLSRFDIQIGHANYFFEVRGEDCSRLLYLSDVRKSLIELSGLKFLLSRAEELIMSKLNSVNDVVYELDEDGFSHLKIFEFWGDYEVQRIINSVERANPCNAFQSLEELHLGFLSNLENISNCKLGPESFSKLRIVHIFHCDKLKNLFPLSIAKELETIEVTDCNSMEAIFSYETEEAVTPDVEINDVKKIEFPRLRVLKLEHLQNLVQFIGEVKKTSMQTEEKPNTEDCAFPVFFHAKVAFPNLKMLEFSRLEKLKVIWKDDQEFSADSFGKLEEISIILCDNLVKVCSVNVLAKLGSLVSLDIKWCDRLEEVFDFKRSVKTVEGGCDMTTTQLSNLSLYDLPNLKRVWSMDPSEGAFTIFQKLEQVFVSQCPSLKSMFPASVAKSLLQLKRLDLSDCDELMEVVAKDEEREEMIDIPKTAFPHLTTLELGALPKLVCFYPGLNSSVQSSHSSVRSSHSSVRSSLGESKVQKCWKGFRNKISAVAHVSNTPTQPHPAFVEKVMFPKLEKLTLNKIQHDLCDILGGADQYAEMLQHIRRLNLKILPKLMHLWREDSPSDTIFQKLESLGVLKCGKLKNLAPSSLSFRNLTTLQVRNCHGMVHLLPSSTARTMVNLKRMTVIGCKRMIEVIANDEGGEVPEKGEIVFGQLELLVLDWLPSLTGFHSGHNQVMRFPSLTTLIVHQCCEMKSFSSQALAPKLRSIITTVLDVELRTTYVYETLEQWYSELEEARRLEHVWKGDINTTLQDLWENGYRIALQDLFNEEGHQQQDTEFERRPSNTGFFNDLVDARDMVPLPDDDFTI